MQSVTVAKLKTLVYLVPQRKKGKLYFENRGKAHDTDIITSSSSKFLNSRESDIVQGIIKNVEMIEIVYY